MTYQKITYVTFLMLVGANLLAQSYASERAFEVQYPEAKQAEWGLDGDILEVEFWLDGKEAEARYYPNGKWLSTEMEIAPEELPEIIRKAVKEEFPGGKIVESEINTHPKGTWYTLEIVTSWISHVTLYNVRGDQLADGAIRVVHSDEVQDGNAD